MTSKKIVLIEDEQDMAELVAMQLRREHYEVAMAHEGNAGLELIRQVNPDLILLDLMLPGLSGTEIASAVRNDPDIANTPIIMLTAKSEESDVVVGLKLGADDYVTKPFSMSVLIARINAVLRRSVKAPSQDGEIIKYGPITIDRSKHRVKINDEEIILTLTEFRLLDAILAARGRVLSRNQLIDKALGFDTVVTDRTIDVHITALRKKLGPARKLIQTIRGIGYKLANNEE